MQVSPLISVKPKSAVVVLPFDSTVVVNQDSFIIEFDAKTKAKTVKARANWAPGFRSTIAAGAGLAVEEVSSPIRGGDTSPLMKLHLVRCCFKRASQ